MLTFWDMLGVTCQSITLIKTKGSRFHARTKSRGS
jgi:hypothetical protein